MQVLFEEIGDLDLTKLQWLASPQEKALEALRFLLDGSLTEQRNRHGGKTEAVELKNLAWCFVANKSFRPLPVRTFATLEKLIDAGMIYFTPNAFFSRKAKTTDALRWLNALYIDIDDPAATVSDVLDRCAELNLPPPSLIVKTQHGLHCYWKIKRVRATERALKLYSRLLRALTKAFDADLRAATAERFLRIPRVILHFDRAEYELKDFFSLLEDETLSTQSGGRVVARGILDHPAVKKLLGGVSEHSRNHACFTLARAFRYCGYSYAETLQELLRWNRRNDRGSDPHRDSEVRATVKSAYNEKQIRPPAASWIRELSGMPFSYRIFEKRGGGKPGRPRKIEETREKFIATIQAAGGTLTTCDSRKKLAAQLGVSERTLNSVVAALIAEGSLTVSTTRLGRGKGTETTYTIASQLEAACSESCKAIGRGGGSESGMRQVLEDAIECCFKFSDVTGRNHGKDLAFFVKLLLRYRKKYVLEKTKVRDPTRFFVETPRW